MNKLKNHWGIYSNLQLTLILLVFAINGSLSAIIAKPVLHFIGISIDNIHFIIYWLLYFLVMTLIYFTLLIFISKLFGQHSFFKKFAEKSLTPFGFKRFF